MNEEATKLQWSKEAVLHLIELWESYECLYNPSHKFYHNKHARYQALNELAESLNRFVPGIGPFEVKLKINYLRGQYTREVGKCNTNKSGAGTDEAYVPNAFWFKNLGFLTKFLKVRKGENNSSFPDDSANSHNSERESSSPTGPSKKRARPSNEIAASAKENDVLEAAIEALKCVTKKTSSDLDANDDAFCKFLMQEFRTLQNVEIKEELKESFVHLLFQAKKKERKMVQSSYEVTLYD
ncbi:uncharacterized protein LOC118737351 isoform X1 [Rhagoletis pomonella]|uniref:uncharacterized protein LOC118737351 isoform X1 n=1 Tax=Rhagoletis pomonella TaxID=28610 RepID=UPI0017864885|nr:uncharacterized protein LOC118737351 isoform X1 [Rhagoletis pomonella]